MQWIQTVADKRRRKIRDKKKFFKWFFFTLNFRTKWDSDELHGEKNGANGDLYVRKDDFKAER